MKTKYCLAEGYTAMNFNVLSKKELADVLSWRNSTEVRSMMNSSGLIAIDEHLEYVESLRLDASKCYYKVDEIGVIYFTELNSNTPSIGLYANMENSEKAKGHILMKMIIHIAFDELGLDVIYLEVLESNSRAINLYKKFGFTQMSTKEGRIRMKLSYDRL